MQNYLMPVVGLDTGDKYCDLCVFEGAEEEPSEKTRIRTTKPALEANFGRRPPSLVALEVGTHSPWISRLLESLGHEVLVANPRKLKAISECDDKDDSVDAEMLARLARSDRKLLRPVKHRSERHQEALEVVRSRDALVRARTQLINHSRGVMKSIGERLPTCASYRFHKLREDMSESRRVMMEPVLRCIEEISNQIQGCERKIDELCRGEFSEAAALVQVGGVGTVTALAFILTLEDPERFARARDVGSFVGLRPKRDKSGNRDPQLRITKAGSSYLRKLLVNCSQYILGVHGPDSDMRRWGLKLAERGGKNAKKRAVVAVARKLSILLFRLWKTQEGYEPLRNAEKQEAKQAGKGSSCNGSLATT